VLFAEPATEVVALLAPIEAEAQQRLTAWRRFGDHVIRQA
jgi:hypothetical protein